MLKKLRNFAKAHKGAELVEIILGVVIAVGVLAVAITYISKTIQSHTSLSDGDTTISDSNKPNNN